MLSMVSNFAKRDLTREEMEETEREHKNLAGEITNMLSLLPRMGAVSDALHPSLDALHSSLKKKLRDLDLLPEAPLGTNFYIYIEELVPPLRAGIKETQDFIKNWKGRG